MDKRLQVSVGHSLSYTDENCPCKVWIDHSSRLWFETRWEGCELLQKYPEKLSLTKMGTWITWFCWNG